jgi:hypothetical protein
VLIAAPFPLVISRYARLRRFWYPQNVGWRRAAGLRTVGRDRSPQQPKEIAMNRFQRLRRLAAALAGLAGALLAFAAAAPAAFAMPPPAPLIPLQDKHPPLPPAHVHYPVHQAPAPAPVHTMVVGGMPGWQIALIAAGAALLAATLAVLADRAWTARRKPVTAAA